MYPMATQNGASQPTRNSRTTNIAVSVVAVVLVLCLVAGDRQMHRRPVITEREYARLYAGMRYVDVMAVLHDPGEVLEERREDRNIIMRARWRSDENGQILITFVNGRLARKEAVGLPPH
jgi:hypothetical protein